ncbi:MAG: pirin family protein [Abditibacteriaceae bacterium]
MKTTLHLADSRGHAERGWLTSWHTFSFADYHDPDRMHFGVLRVINDDIIAGGMGFPTHPHDNMEIITIVRKGTLAHKDSMGNEGVIEAGDIQVMSAGTGVRHSEFNALPDTDAELFQIWAFPNEKNVEPRYEQLKLEEGARENKFQQIISPNADDDGLWIHQDAWFHLAKIDSGTTLNYDLKNPGNGVYLLVIEGDVSVGDQKLHRRDGLEIEDAESFEVTADEDAEVLLMEVPMRG